MKNRFVNLATFSVQISVLEMYANECIFNQIIHKSCKNHKLLLVTKHIFCHNPKANGKVQLSTM